MLSPSWQVLGSEYVEGLLPEDVRGGGGGGGGGDGGGAGVGVKGSVLGRRSMEDTICTCKFTIASQH